MTVFERLLRVVREKGAGFLVLIDPDELTHRELQSIAEVAEEAGADAILVGGSLVLSTEIDTLIKEMKRRITIPVITFPGSADQLSRFADAVLFISLLSGRNPEFLIGEQVKGASRVKEFGLEAIPTAYLLIESGAITSVQYLSHTLPIPRDKIDIAKAHALAAEYLGMKVVYLEAGSGARLSVPEEMVSAVGSYISLPVICGGGIRHPEEAERKVQAGASFVVIGNRFQGKSSAALYGEFAEAIHRKKAASVGRQSERP